MHGAGLHGDPSAGPRPSTPLGCLQLESENPELVCEELNTSTQPGPMQVLSLGLFRGLLILRQVKIISKRGELFCGLDRPPTPSSTC